MSNNFSDKETIKENFFDVGLLKTEYLHILEQHYDSCDKKLLNLNRNYCKLLNLLNAIHYYNKEHAKSFIKRIKDQQKDFKNCEAVFSEVIVYEYYLSLFYEGIIKSLNVKEDDYDLGIEMADNSFNYLEVFCIMPERKNKLTEKDEVVLNNITSHLQEEGASIRKKLLNKIKKQNQMSKPRNNFAVIEINDPFIDTNFVVLSSFSSGYKISVNTETGKLVNENFDWDSSVFDEIIVQNLKGIIYFRLGDYTNRRFIFNPNYNKGK